MPDVRVPIPFEAYVGSLPYIFASYAHKDGEVVFGELSAIHAMGFRVWYDEGIDPGNEWPEEIATAITDCALFLVFVSKAAIASRNVRNEINFALNRGKRLLAVYIEDTALPPGLELRMGDIQGIMKWRMASEGYLRKLKRALPDELRDERAASESQPLPADGHARIEAVRRMEFVLVPEGPFGMGSGNGAGDDQPLHEVHLDAYEMGRYPVTVAQFSAFVAVTGHEAAPDALRDPGRFGEHPVTWVSWDDAVAFCAWASKVTGRQVRLPTEAEWEKAARGADGRQYPWGNEAPSPAHGNYGGTKGGTTPIGAYSPRGDSPYGAADMAGNVWEWCADWYDSGYYRVSPKRNPQGPASGTGRVVRGGSWNSTDVYVRAAYRSDLTPGHRVHFIGFRCARSP